MTRPALSILVVVIAIGIYVIFLRENPFLSLALGIVVGGFLVALQARSKKP